MRIFFLLLLNLSFLKINQAEHSYSDKINSHNQEIIREGEIKRFLSDFRQYESKSNYSSVNNISCIGAWQFRIITLNLLGYVVDLKKFKKNPDCFPKEIQDQAMIKLLKSNEESLKDFKIKINDTLVRHINILADWDGITKVKLIYNFKSKKDTLMEILITKAGLLAGCHLAGVWAVYCYLYYDNDKFIDYNGTHISHYLKRFANYKF